MCVGRTAYARGFDEDGVTEASVTPDGDVTVVEAPDPEGNEVVGFPDESDSQGRS